MRTSVTKHMLFITIITCVVMNFDLQIGDSIGKVFISASEYLPLEKI